MKQVATFLLLFALGMLVFFVGGYWAGMPYAPRAAVKTILPVLLFAAVLACQRVEALRRWRPVLLSLLAASCAFLVSWWVSGPLLRLSGYTTESVPGIALAKLFDALPIVVTALVVCRLGGVGPAQLYLRRGRVGAWAVIGGLAFTVFLTLFLLQSRQAGLGFEQLLALAPWTLLFISANAFMEELHFRGLLLKPFEDLLGRRSANLCIALFFTLVHAPVRYTPDILAFLAVLLVLALAWGYVIQRTEALWGAVLFHAGADLMIVLGIYDTYGGLG